MSPEAIEVVRQMAWLAMDQLDAQEKGMLYDDGRAKNRMAKECLWALLDALPPKAEVESHDEYCSRMEREFKEETT